MNSAYNQTALNKQSGRITQFVIANQQFEFNGLFFDISMRPAAFSAFTSKLIRLLILNEKVIRYLDYVFNQSQTKQAMFKILDIYHQILLKENMKTAPDGIKTHLTQQKSNNIPYPTQPFYAMCDASNFRSGAALLESHQGTNEMNLISASSRLFTQSKLRLSTLIRECTAIKHTFKKNKFLILG